MSVDPKVMAAISSAVGYYLQAEQEAPLSLAPLQTQQQLSRPTQPPTVMSSPFALAGRQAAMDMRWAWQMRLPR